MNTLSTPSFSSAVTSEVGDDPAAEDDDVRGVALLEQADDLREQGHVRAAQEADADPVDVLLDGGLDDHRRGLVQPGVDHLDARVPERPGDHLDAAVVPVEADLGGEDPDLASGRRRGGGVHHVRC